MSPGEVYEHLVGLLNPSGSRHRSSSEISDGFKRIRRMVLTEGIPEVVRTQVLAMRRSRRTHPPPARAWSSHDAIFVVGRSMRSEE
jgi:hypothetical protein